MKRALIAAGLLLGLGLVAAPARAQTGTARGKVVDAQGQPVQDAKVLIEFQGGITRKFEVKTNKKGEFMQVGMQPGPYRFTVTKEGFSKAVLDAVVVEAARVTDVEVQLKIGETSTAVEVRQLVRKELLLEVEAVAVLHD